MSVFTNQTKSSSTYSNISKSVSTFLNYMRHGVVPTIQQSDRAFTDPYYLNANTGDVTFDSIYTEPWSNQTKN